MSYTSISSKTAGSSTLTSTDLANIEANVAWFRTRPSFRIYYTDTTKAIFTNVTFVPVGYNDALTSDQEWFEEWLSPDSPLTYFAGAGTGGDTNENLIYVGDIEAGLWLVGGFCTIERDATGKREFRLVRRTSGNELATQSDRGVSGRNTSAHLCTVFDFQSGSTVDSYRLEGYQDSGATLDRSVTRMPPRWWAMWLAEETTSSDAWTPVRVSSGANPATWWNRVVTCMNRLQARPAARVHRGVTQSINDTTWTQVTHDTLDYETDPDLVDATEVTIDIQHSGVYWVCHGAEFDLFNTAGSRMWSDIAITGTRQGLIAGSTDVASGDANVNGTALLWLDSGDALSQYVNQNSGSSATLNPGVTTYLSATLMSGDPADLDAARQSFIESGLPTMRTYSDQSSTKLTTGYGNFVSDVLDYLWSPPVLIRRVKRQDGASARDREWTTINLTRTVSDPHGMIADGLDVVSGAGGFKAPHDGTYLCWAWVSISNIDDNDEAAGDSGSRGLRIVVNGQPIARCFSQAGTASTQNWYRSVSELHILEEGDEVDVQVWSNNANETDMTIAECQLGVVWVGDSVTLLKE